MPKNKSYVAFFALFYKDRTPGQRYRIEAYIRNIPTLYNNYYSIVQENDEKTYYGNVSFFTKFGLFVKLFTKRTLQLFLLLNKKNVVVAREAFPVGTIFFEFIIKKIFRKKLIFDFDDAIWIKSLSEHNKRFAFLKSSSKYATIIRWADVVIAGNGYLAAYAQQYNSNVHVIPSCIDLDIYTLSPQNKSNDRICIGWSGSQSTLAHLLTIKDVLVQLQAKYGNQIYFKIICHTDEFVIDGIDMFSVKWTKETEVDALREFDIGIMPLPDDEWSKGKCAMKAIQYMGLAIPAVVSNVGVNAEVVQDGICGYVASTPQEWLDAFSQLIDDQTKRQAMGTLARKRVENHYSIQIWQKQWLKLVTESP